MTTTKSQVGAVVLVKAKRMQEPWCLATSLVEAKAAEVVKLYSRRFTIEETFRDTKDLHFGLGRSAIHIRDASAPQLDETAFYCSSPWHTCFSLCSGRPARRPDWTAT